MIRIDRLALELASLAAEGAVTLDANRKATGQVSVSVGGLADPAPLIGKPLSGTIDASVSLSQDDGGQAVDARISASGVDLPGVADVGRAELSLQLIDLLTEPGVVARFEAGEIRAGDVALDRAVVTAEGDLEGFDCVLDLTGEILAANARGQVALAGGETRIEVAAFSARYAGTGAALAGPARITLARDLLLIDGLVLQAER